MRQTAAIVFLALLATAAVAADEYRPAKIVDAGQDTEVSGNLLTGFQSTNENMLTVELDGMRYTVTYETLFAGGRRAAGNFVVGAEVQARVHRDKWVYVMRENGKPIKARITRREMVPNE